jgi:hypothetical protein
MIEIVAEAERERHAGGTPPSVKQEKVAATERSFTGQYLRATLAKAPVQSEPVEVPKVRKRGKRVAVADQPDLIEAK